MIKQLLRIAAGKSNCFSCVLASEEWTALFSAAVRQGIAAYLFSGVERLPSDQRPPLECLMDWAAIADYVEQRNRKLNGLCVKVHDAFKREGAKVCLLKGQGMGMCYPHPLRRDFGDIDIWMAGGKQHVETFVGSKFKEASVGDGSHHVSFIMDDVDVEVHHTPATLYNPLHNRRLQHFFEAEEAAQWDTMVQLSGQSEKVCVPTMKFNLVYILVHLFHHWAFEGCGLKQLIDYSWLLATTEQDDDVRKTVVKQLKALGLGNFLAAVMAVLEDIGVDACHLLCAPNRQLGKALWQDVLYTGLVTAEDLSTGKFAQENKRSRFVRRLKRAIRVLPLAPSELPWMLARNVWVWVRWNAFKN